MQRKATSFVFARCSSLLNSVTSTQRNTYYRNVCLSKKEIRRFRTQGSIGGTVYFCISNTFTTYLSTYTFLSVRFFIFFYFVLPFFLLHLHLDVHNGQSVVHASIFTAANLTYVAKKVFNANTRSGVFFSIFRVQIRAGYSDPKIRVWVKTKKLKMIFNTAAETCL